MIADLTNTKQLVYTGPVNSLMRKLQISLTATTVGSFVGSPLLLHYFTSGWTWTSQLFFITSSKLIKYNVFKTVCSWSCFDGSNCNWS